MNEPPRFTGLRGTLARDAPLARYTSWRCGGAGRSRLRPGRSRRSRGVRAPAARRRAADRASGSAATCWCATAACAAPSCVLHAGAARARRCATASIYAEAGVASPKVARFAAMHGCADAEFLAGIPGTVGGALAMNAGCYGGETWRYVARVEVLDARRQLRGAHARRLRDRLPQRAPRRRRARPTASSPRRGSRFRAGDGARRARAHQGAAARGASRRSRSTCRTPAACSAIRPATTRRG